MNIVESLKILFTMFWVVLFNNRNIFYKVKVIYKFLYVVFHKFLKIKSKYKILPIVGMLPQSEIEILDIFLKNKNFKVFIDIGAHVGKYSIMMAILNKNGKIISIEPHPQNFRIVINNVDFYNLENISAINAACYSKNKRIKLYLDPKGSAGHSLKKHVKGIHDFKEYIIVKAIRLDSLIKNQQIDLIKIDVEGAELDVLKGCEKVLNRTRGIIFETWREKDVKRIENFLNKFGFTTTKTTLKHYYFATRKSE